MYKSQKGEIATFIAIATLIGLTVFTFIVSNIVTTKKETTSTKAAYNCGPSVGTVYRNCDDPSYDFNGSQCCATSTNTIWVDYDSDLEGYPCPDGYNNEWDGRCTKEITDCNYNYNITCSGGEYDQVQGACCETVDDEPVYTCGTLGDGGQCYGGGCQDGMTGAEGTCSSGESCCKSIPDERCQDSDSTCRTDLWSDDCGTSFDWTGTCVSGGVNGQCCKPKDEVVYTCTDNGGTCVTTDCGNAQMDNSDGTCEGGSYCCKEKEPEVYTCTDNGGTCVTTDCGNAQMDHSDGTCEGGSYCCKEKEPEITPLPDQYCNEGHCVPGEFECGTDYDYVSGSGCRENGVEGICCRNKEYVDPQGSCQDTCIEGNCDSNEMIGGNGDCNNNLFCCKQISYVDQTINCSGTDACLDNCSGDFPDQTGNCKTSDGTDKVCCKEKSYIDQTVNCPGTDVCLDNCSGDYPNQTGNCETSNGTGKVCCREKTNIETPDTVEKQDCESQLQGICKFSGFIDNNKYESIPEGACSWPYSCYKERSFDINAGIGDTDSEGNLLLTQATQSGKDCESAGGECRLNLLGLGDSSDWQALNGSCGYFDGWAQSCYVKKTSDQDIGVGATDAEGNLTYVGEGATDAEGNLIVSTAEKKDCETAGGKCIIDFYGIDMSKYELVENGDCGLIEVAESCYKLISAEDVETGVQGVVEINGQTTTSYDFGVGTINVTTVPSTYTEENPAVITVSVADDGEDVVVNWPEDVQYSTNFNDPYE